MKPFFNKLAAGTAIAALCAAGLLAQATHATTRSERFQRQGRFLRVMETALNMSDAQKTQANAAFQEARKSAQPIRQQLMETHKSLRAAVQAGNTEQIQQLSATEGNEIGQLTAIRSDAFAKVYKTLTPAQREKLTALQQAMHPARRGAGARSGRAAS